MGDDLGGAPSIGHHDFDHLGDGLIGASGTSRAHGSNQLVDGLFGNHTSYVLDNLASDGLAIEVHGFVTIVTRIWRVSGGKETGGTLEEGDGLAQITLAAADEGVKGVGVDGYSLDFGNVLKALSGIPLIQALEAEFAAAAGERVDDAGDIVADEAKAGDFAVRLHGTAQGALGILRHGVGLVEDDDLEGRAGILVLVRGRRVGQLHAGEILDLFANDGDAAFVGGVEFEDAGPHHLGAEELLCEGQDGGCLAGARRAVEEHVR